MISVFTADELIMPATLPESSHAHDVSAADVDVGFTVLGEVKPRTLKKVHQIDHLMSLRVIFLRMSSVPLTSYESCFSATCLYWRLYLNYLE